MGSRFFYRSTVKHARPIVCARDYEGVKALLNAGSVLNLVANRGEYRVEALIREVVEYENAVNGGDFDYSLGWTEYVTIPYIAADPQGSRRWSDSK